MFFEYVLIKIERGTVSNRAGTLRKSLNWRTFSVSSDRFFRFISGRCINLSRGAWRNLCGLSWSAASKDEWDEERDHASHWEE